MKSIRKRRVLQLTFWTAAWTGSIALVKYGSKHLWDENSIVSLLAIVVNILLGLAMIWINRKFVNESDELERKIQLESMAITLGLTLIIGLAISLLDYTRLISFPTEISTLITFMGIIYISSMVLNTLRYR